MSLLLLLLGNARPQVAVAAAAGGVHHPLVVPPTLVLPATVDATASIHVRYALEAAARLVGDPDEAVVLALLA